MSIRALQMNGSSLIYAEHIPSSSIHVDTCRRESGAIAVASTQVGERVTACRAERWSYKVAAVPVFLLNLTVLGPQPRASGLVLTLGTSVQSFVTRCSLCSLQNKCLAYLANIRYLCASRLSIAQEHSKYFTNTKRHPKALLLSLKL
jgi:hypothetical protein